MAPGMHSKRNALVFYFVKCDALRWFYYNLLYMVLAYVGHTELLNLKNSGHGFMLCIVIILFLVFGNCHMCPA